jgi:hypothetical protein
MSQKLEKPTTAGEDIETPIHIGYAFKVLATAAIGECIEVDNSTNPPSLLLKFSDGRTEWHCRSKVDNADLV